MRNLGWGTGARNAHLQVLVLGDDEEDAAAEDSGQIEEDEEEPIQCERIEVALRAVMGFTTQESMKMQAHFHQSEVVVMIDSGATHNFIHAGLVEELGLPTSGNRAFGVTLGDGRTETRRGECKGLTVELPNF